MKEKCLNQLTITLPCSVTYVHGKPAVITRHLPGSGGGGGAPPGGAGGGGGGGAGAPPGGGGGAGGAEPSDNMNKA